MTQTTYHNTESQYSNNIACSREVTDGEDNQRMRRKFYLWPKYDKIRIEEWWGGPGGDSGVAWEDVGDSEGSETDWWRPGPTQAELYLPQPAQLTQGLPSTQSLSHLDKTNQTLPRARPGEARPRPVSQTGAEWGRVIQWASPS